MGQEAFCTARWGGKSVRGKASLETSELVFRGDARLKIPFSSIRQVNAENGELQLTTGDGLVVLELGERAEKWRQKIVHPKTVVEKLGIKPGEAVAVVGSLDGGFLKKLKAQKSKVVQGAQGPDPQCIFLGAEARVDLAQVRKIVAKMQGSAALWVVYPKGQKNIAETDVIAAGRKAGVKDVKVVGFSATHTALKFVIPVEKR